MGSIWTPGGEHPVDRDSPAGPDRGPGRVSPDASGNPSGDADQPDIDELRRQLAQTPAAVVVMNHCLGLWELAALHLSLQPPQLDEATVAIDALGAVVERLEGRLGPDESTLRDALAQVRVAFVQIKAATASHADQRGSDDA